jgi:hypothetical protein
MDINYVMSIDLWLFIFLFLLKRPNREPLLLFMATLHFATHTHTHHLGVGIISKNIVSQ